MKAIRVEQFGDPEVLVVRDVPDPVAQAGQVVVKVHAAGVNPVETYIRSGKYASKPSLPYTPGNDGGGVIESVGTGVARLKPGDRVYIAGSLSGTYAEKCLCDASRCHPLPENVSFAQGAAIGVPYGTAYRALLQRGHVRPSDTVLIHGASGGVGIAGVQIAAALGCRVIGTAGTERGKALVWQQGAAFVADHTGADYVEQILSFAGGGVNLVVEMLANVNLERDLRMLAPGGRVMVVGNRGRVEIDPRETMGREADIRGVFLGGASPAEYAEMHSAIRAGLASGTLKPIINRELPLEQASEAHRLVMSPGAYGKIVLVP